MHSKPLTHMGSSTYYLLTISTATHTHTRMPALINTYVLQYVQSTD